MDFERRAQYRVETDESTDLHLSIHNPHGSAYSARLLDVSASGVGARFFLPGCPHLAVGQEVVLVFSCELLEQPLQTPATVQSRIEEGGARRYGFHFKAGHDLDARNPPEVRPLFNRRGAVRVAPDPDSPVNVVVKPSAGSSSVEVRLVDISATGAGIGLSAEAESPLARTTRVDLGLFLPGASDPIRFAGTIRHSHLAGSEVHCGIQFDPELTEDFAEQQEIIREYVRRPQDAMMRGHAFSRLYQP